MLSPSGTCGKLFKSRAHTVKHLLNKHAKELAAGDARRLLYVCRPLTQADYFNQYLADPMRVAPSGAEPAERPPRAPRETPRRVAEPVAPPAHYRDLDAGATQEPLELSY